MTYLDVLPILFAIIAIIAASMKAQRVRRRADFFSCIMSVIAGMILIVAQSSWSVGYVMENNFVGTTFTNVLRTTFNIVVMVIIILNNLPRLNK